MKARVLHRMLVESCEDGVHWTERGSVLLPWRAKPHEVEHALAAVGLYTPRGADRLNWSRSGHLPAAFINDANGTPMVRMCAAIAAAKGVSR